MVGFVLVNNDAVRTTSKRPFEDSFAQRIISVVDDRVSKRVRSGAGVEQTWGTIAGVSADNKTASAYLYGDTSNPSVDFRVRGSDVVTIGDSVRLSMDERGDRWVEESSVPFAYKKVEVDPSTGDIRTGDGTAPPTTRISASGLPSVAHADLTGVSADQHHAQSHSHASHTGIAADDHHAQAHNHSTAASGTSIIIPQGGVVDLTGSAGGARDTVQLGANGLVFGGDTEVLAPSAGFLRVLAPSGADGVLQIMGPSGKLAVLRTAIVGDSNARFSAEGDATFTGIELGPGNASRDVNLYRSAANVLKTDDAFTAADGVVKMVGARGRNLIANPGFEFDGNLGYGVAPTGWTSHANIQLSSSSHWGTYARYFLQPATPADLASVTTAFMPVEESESYIVRMWFRGVAGNAAGCVARLRTIWYDDTFTQITSVSSSSTIGASTTWTIMDTRRTPPALAVWAKVQIQFDGAGSSAGNAIIIDDVAFYSENDFIPTGIIVMFTGQTTAIPNGWALCDGTNGTPDLRDRFIIGADSTNENTSGGTISPAAAITSHGFTQPATHGAHSNHAFTQPSNHTTRSDLTTGGIAVAVQSFSHSGGAVDAHSAHAAHSGGAVTGAHEIMKFYRLCFIMKL